MKSKKLSDNAPQLESSESCTSLLDAPKAQYTAYCQHLRRTAGKLLQTDVSKNKTQTVSVEYARVLSAEDILFEPLNLFKKGKQHKQ